MPDPNASRPVIEIDYDLYARYMAEADLSEEEARAFLDALWSIIVTFVDLGFGVHPVQSPSISQHGEGCEQKRKIASDSGADMLYSSSNLPSKNKAKEAVSASDRPSRGLET